MTFEDINRQAVSDWRAMTDGKSPCIYIDTSTYGNSAGLIIRDYINAALKQRDIDTRVISVGGCGPGYLSPFIQVGKPGRPRICYSRVTPEIIDRVIADYIIKDNPGPDLAFCSLGPGKIEGIPVASELPVFKDQVRIILRNCGYIDPENINHYIAQGGYSGLAKALKLSSEDVIAEVLNSGLKGRGGAGYPAGKKWQICREAAGAEKYVICNAHEGDPEASLNRSLLESDPHSVLEGMLIGAYAVGADHGYIFIRSDYNLAIARLKIALKQMSDYGLLGDRILGTGFNFQIEIREAPSDLVCGEESAMIMTLEGKRAMPCSRPPFPAASGYKGCPTLVNNAETLAGVSIILQKGAGWYVGCGTAVSKGTKVFRLSGVNRPGLIEVPLGTSLRKIIYDIGGGLPGNKSLKTVMIGGPTGGCLTAESLDMEIDYDNLAAAGAIMGSGTIMVFDTDSCIVDLAKQYAVFTAAESCGKCVMCREGTFQIQEILKDITGGSGKLDQLDLLMELAEAMSLESFCALGRTAANPVLTTLKHFRGEYEAHIKDHRCPAGVCFKSV